MEALTRTQLQAYAEDAKRAHIEGPPVSLPADLATPFGLVLHELATNAAKYGSLSTAGGIISVTWDVTERSDGRHLRLTWREQGGPRPAPDAVMGFGSRLIGNGIPTAVVRREFRSEGLLCAIDLPLPAEQ